MKRFLEFFIIFCLSYFATGQCTNSSSYGSASAPTTTGVTVTISSCNYQTEYSTVSGFVSGNTYSLNYSLGGCITIHSGSPSGPVVAFGTAPLLFNPTTSGTYYIHYNVNCTSCATATGCGTSTVTMTAGTTPAPAGCVGGQNNNCATSDPFCTGTAYNYCNSTGVSSSGSYNCLLSTPNPMWMYLNVQTSGSIDIQIQQFTSAGAGIDVDFALYGPYTGIGSACSAINGTTVPVDCSYSTAYTEYANITNAVAGQWYMLLITNFNGSAGYIQFNQTGGTGTTNCNIVNPSCLITGVTATPSNCNGSNQYSVSGAISVSNPPSTGTLTVSSSCGGSQTFNAPFTSPINYNLSGLTPTGGSCTVTATFSSVSCSLTQTYTSPTIPTINGGVDQTVCANTAVTLTATGGTSYSWTGGVTNGVPFNPSTTTTYSVTGTNAQGCKATDAVLVMVNSLPTVNAGSDAAICAGASTTLSATGATSYTWSPSTGLNSTTGATVIATPNATSTYTVTGTTGLCTSTDQVVVTVNPLPTTNAGVDQTICIGSSASLIASGATTYSWSPSTDLSATTGASVVSSSASTITYTVTGSTGSGCTSTDQVIVNVNPVATVNANIDQSVCAGGVITLAGLVGGSATSGAWSASSGSFSNANSLTSTYTPSLTSGSVILTFTSNDPSGPCSAVTDQMIVTINASPIVNAGSDASICIGGSTSLIASGASSYSWSPSVGLSSTTGSSVIANPSSTTSYTVTGTSVAGCTLTDVVVVAVNPLPTINAGVDQTICQGPTVTLAASGASSYSWTGGITNGTPFTPIIGSTSYTVTGTSAAGCTSTDDVVVTVNAVPVIVANDISVCATNTVAVTASGGANYTWSPATNLSTTSGANVTFTPGSTTTYTVTGTSVAGCTSTDQATVSVLSNAPINAGPDIAICIGSSASLTATGGVTYSWNNGLGSGNGFSVSPTIATTYTVFGTDAAGCQGTDAIIVSVNPLPVTNGGTDQTVCSGTSITLSGSGASTYSWDNGVANGTPFIPAATTNFTVTGTSAAGCSSTDQVLVTINPLPTVYAGVDQTVCAGTSIGLSGSGASSYTWSGGVSNGVAFAPSTTTTYTLTGTSAAGCTSTDQVIVNVNPLPAVNAGSDQIVCDGSSVTLTASGASIYSWTGGVVNGTSFIPTLGNNNYTVTGTSPAGCTSTDQANVIVNPIPLPVIQGPTEYCIGNFAVLSTSQTYSSYSWSNGATTGSINATYLNNPISVTVTNSFGCSALSSNFNVSENSVITANFTQTICQGESAIIHGMTETVPGVYSQTFASTSGCDSVSNVTLIVYPLPLVNAGSDITVCEGTEVTLSGSGALNYSWNNGILNNTPFTQTIGSFIYTLTGTDVNGCVNTDQTVVLVNPLPSINAGTDQIICFGQSVTLTGSGGTAYQWNNSVSDGISFNPTLTNTFTVTGTDINGCINSDQVLITVHSLPTVNAGIDQAICVGETVLLAGSGASVYTWDNAVVNNVLFSPISTSTYTVNGTDLNGCINSDQVEITVHPLPSVDAGNDQTVCLGVNITLNGAGASTYTWDNGVQNGVSFSPSLGTLNYTVTGTTNVGCTNSDQVSITVNPLPIVFAGSDVAICAGESVTLVGSGSNTYTWNNGVVDGISFSPSSTLTYTLTGTSSTGCTSSDQVIITVNQLPTVNAGNDISVCDGTAVTLTASGAATYEWNNGITNGLAFNSPIGTTIYTVTGTSAAGCENSDQVNVSVNTAPLVGFVADTTIGCAPLLVNFTNTTSGSSNCVWTLSDGTVLSGCGSVSNLFDQIGCFDVTLTVADNNGCTNSLSAAEYICTEAAPIASFTPSTTEISNVSTEVSFLNSTYGASSYDWSFGESSYSSEENPVYVFPMDEGDYIVTLVASSPLGCTDIATATITLKEELIFFVPNTFTPDDDDYNEVFKPVFYSGFDPYDFSLFILNRWGEVVFESHDATVGWDGSYGSNNEVKIVEDGTYTWIIRYRITESKAYRKATGHVNVIR